ncbi:MAG: type transport system ATP-binding protein [Frankiales bacterium]|jgi:ABC-2 type transport system ATP-binding protein|nr:type transport system ATP-binding protein [Frankiales bacterium]
MTATATPCFAVRGLVRSYPGRTGKNARPAVVATDNVDLAIEPGQVYGLLGPNGAGKTSLVRQLIGLLTPDSGTVRLFGQDVTGRPDLVSRRVAYLAQSEPALDELSVRVAVDTTGRLRGLPKRRARTAADGLVDQLGLGPIADRPLGKLSGGQRRLAGVATALIGERAVLVLDEPTTGLDPQARRAVWDALHSRRELGTTVVLVTHNVLEAESVLDRVAVLDRGRVIADDTPGRLKALVSDEVRLDLVWRQDPPMGDPTVAMLAARATVNGRRWTTRMAASDAREALALLTGGPAFQALDDFTLATPSLEDVYLTLGGAARDLERA